MSYGKMNTFISIAQKQKQKDSEGFVSDVDVTIATIRAYREGRHGSERWANRAAFTDATDLFRFRAIPNLSVTTAMCFLCDNHRFEITSVEDAKGKGMYIEVMAKEVVPSG